LHSSATLSALLGYPSKPFDDLLIFNIAFGKTVPDISLNAVANLGYADIRFVSPVFSGDTLHCESVILGLRENTNKKTGVVYVRSTCYNQHDCTVLSWIRWVMVHKKKETSHSTENYVPLFDSFVGTDQLIPTANIPSRDILDEWCENTCSTTVWDNFSVGDTIVHPSGMTIEEADHMQATRLYQNNARPHFDEELMKDTKFGKRLVYGGHVISICRALSYDGLENVISILAINSGTHVNPTTAGDTLYARTEVLDKWKIPSRSDVGALRLRLLGYKNSPTSSNNMSNQKIINRDVKSELVLDLDYTVLMPKKQN
jgi:2-methylfumaryl-CoA hydratase